MKPYLITPFKHLAATQRQKRFNKALSKARINVECAFGQALSRWRRIRFIYMHELLDICNLVLVACTLHNFCKAENEPVFEDDDVHNVATEHHTNDNNNQMNDVTGISRRNQLLELF